MTSEYYYTVLQFPEILPFMLTAVLSENLLFYFKLVDIS